MSAPRRTPGPYAFEYQPTAYRYMLTGSNGEAIAFTLAGTTPDYHNARFLAASQTMYDALEWLDALIRSGRPYNWTDDDIEEIERRVAHAMAVATDGPLIDPKGPC